MPHSAASEQGLHCLHNTLKEASGLKKRLKLHVFPYNLTHKAPTKIAAGDILIFYFHLSKKMRLDFSCESSARQRIHLKHQVSFSLKNNEKILRNVVCCSCDWRLRVSYPFLSQWLFLYICRLTSLSYICSIAEVVSVHTLAAPLVEVEGGCQDNLYCSVVKAGLCSHSYHGAVDFHRLKRRINKLENCVCKTQMISLCYASPSPTSPPEFPRPLSSKRNKKSNVHVFDVSVKSVKCFSLTA